MAKPNEPVAAVVVRMAAALPVLSTRGVFDSVLRPEQRRELSIQAAKFSPDGRYLAIVAYITGEDSSYGSQVFRYDLVTRKLIGVTPEPTLHTLPSVDQTVWSGDVLYSSVTYTWEMGRSAFFKTTDESTIPIDSFPTELEKPGLGNPFHQPVGPYLVDGEEVHGGGTELSVGKKVIAWVGGPWAFLDNPPVVIYGGNGVHIFHLRTRHDERVNIPNGSGTVVLDATPHSTGLRIAYLSGGECGVDPQSIPPDYAWPQTSLQRLCFVDISEVSRPGLSPQGSASK